MSTPIDAKTLDLIRKLHALMGSNQQDGNASREKLNALLAKHGFSMGDLLAGRVPGLVVAGTSQPSSADGWAADIWRNMYQASEANRIKAESRAREFWEAWTRELHSQATSERQAEERGRKQERDRIAKERAAAEQAQHDRKRAEEKQQDADRIKSEEPERRALIKRYGSIKAVLELNDRELALRKAVRRWTVFCDPPNQHEIYTIDGDDTKFPSEQSDRVIKAIRRAYPLPTTIEDAQVEHAYWARRQREIGIVRKIDWSPRGNWRILDLPAELRQMIVADLLCEDIRARNMKEIMVRHELIDDESCWWWRELIPSAVQADLAALCAAGKTETVVTHEVFRAARQKRETPPVKPRKVHVAQRDFGF